MCSVLECDSSCSNNALQMKIKRPEEECKKCKHPASIVLRKKDSLCRACFLSYCTHKFRSTIGKSKYVVPKDKILLGFSGGSCSSALLHMVQQGINEVSSKRLLFSFGLIYIDEGAVCNLSFNERKKQLMDVCKLMDISGFPSYITSLEMVFKGTDDPFPLFGEVTSEDTLKIKFISNKWTEILCHALSKVKLLTDKEEFLKLLRTNLLIKIAESAGFTKIFVGDTATRISSRLLCDIAQGRGGCLPYETDFIDSRQIIPILRPLREFMNKEVAFYNQFQNIEYTVNPTLSTKTDVRSSVLRLTENFVSGLQEEYPATVSTIFKTGSKITNEVKKQVDANSHSLIVPKCALCWSPRNIESTSSYSALDALNTSQRISSNSTEEFGKNICPCKETSKSFSVTSGPAASSSNNKDTTTFFCHSCQNLIKNMPENYLPSCTLEVIKKLKMQEELINGLEVEMKQLGNS